MTTDMKPETMPAFPLHNGDVWGGMVLRDYFAAKAMQALINSEGDELDRLADVPEYAYQIADAMLKARSPASCHEA